MVKPTKGPNRGAPKVVKVPMRNPLDERGFPKRFREDPLQYIYEKNKPQSPGAMGGATGIDMTPEQRKKFKESISNNKDGGLMEAIRKVDAEKEQRLQDGGMVGNLTSNFKGNY
tara:strand:+ start:240 stop:581 length:342 start_codon:yes stop_codon:yes gene_type:complete